MRPEILEGLRRQLLDQQAALEAIAEASKEAAEPVALDQTRVGRISRMDAMRAQSMAVASERRRQDQLRAIAAALKRMEAGTYGECEECGEEISEGRLKANPTARRCIDCAD